MFLHLQGAFCLHQHLHCLSVLSCVQLTNYCLLAVGGKPVLTDVNTGRFNGAHSPKLFMELYAPEVCIYLQ